MAAAVVGMAAMVTACSLRDPNTTYPETYNYRTTGDPYKKPTGIFGPEGLSFSPFGQGDEGGGSGSGGGGAGVGVNSYLWRASLDTLAFMPLASADPFGGVIITDWYTPQETPQERFKVNVYILGRELRSDGVRASVFRQQQRPDSWIDVPVDDRTSVELENAILTRARQLRIASAE
jgi:hypothetical protein